MVQMVEVVAHLTELSQQVALERLQETIPMLTMLIVLVRVVLVELELQLLAMET